MTAILHNLISPGPFGGPWLFEMAVIVLAAGLYLAYLAERLR